jgi:hypothetical protein
MRATTAARASEEAVRSGEEATRGDVRKLRRKLRVRLSLTLSRNLENPQEPSRTNCLQDPSSRIERTGAKDSLVPFIHD